MKKIAILTLVLVIAMALCACGGSENSAPTTTVGSNQNQNQNTNTGSDTPVGYLFTYNDVQFGVDMPAQKVIEQLGEPKDQYTSKSCAFAGEDTVYYYSSIQISTNDEQGHERIYSIYLEDDLVSTEKGISVGSTAEAVKEAYGTPSSESDAALVYEKDGMSLSFNLKDGAVSTILYSSI